MNNHNKLSGPNRRARLAALASAGLLGLVLAGEANNASAEASAQRDPMLVLTDKRLSQTASNLKKLVDSGSYHTAKMSIQPNGVDEVRYAISHRHLGKEDTFDQLLVDTIPGNKKPNLVGILTGVKDSRYESSEIWRQGTFIYEDPNNPSGYHMLFVERNAEGDITYEKLFITDGKHSYSFNDVQHREVPISHKEMQKKLDSLTEVSLIMSSHADLVGNVA